MAMNRQNFTQKHLHSGERKLVKGVQKILDLCEFLPELSIKMLENDIILSFLLLTLSNHYLWTSQNKKFFDKGLLAALCGFVQMYQRNL